jgi:hypothetical protein
MIYLGLKNTGKASVITEYCRNHGITKTVLLSPEKFVFHLPVKPAESVDWPEIIMYRTFYRLLREIDPDTLVIVNECLRTRNRHDLTYNCIRHYLNQAGHVLVFQWLPMIDSLEDFMILFDFATGSRWKRERFDGDLLSETSLKTIRRDPVIHPVEMETDAATKAKYIREKKKLIDNIGIRDPHTIPRNLHLLGGKAKLCRLWPEQWYVGRNNRFKLGNMQTYKESVYPHGRYTVFEWPHNFIDFADFLYLSGQEEVWALVSDLRVDQWYLKRYRQWARRIHDCYASLSA